MINPFLRTLFQNLHSAEVRKIDLESELKPTVKKAPGYLKAAEDIRATLSLKGDEDINGNILPALETIMDQAHRFESAYINALREHAKKEVEDREILIETYMDTHYEARNVL